MASLTQVFVTTLYRAELDEPGLFAELDGLCRSLAEDDEAGRRWCARHGYPGYTSYASLEDLAWRFPPFALLTKRLDRHVADFARALELDLRGGRLALSGLWVNLLPEGGHHAAHIHPHAAISGTVYVATPPGSGAIRFEDPRLGLMMAAPPRKARASRAQRSFVTEEPSPGTLLLWESFLRHDVPTNRSSGERISISFNYRWR
jgi:uncharacterized protein (TIGR02466 family)